MHPSYIFPKPCYNSNQIINVLKCHFWAKFSLDMHHLWQKVLSNVASISNFYALHYERLKKSFSMIYDMPMMRKCKFHANLP